MFVAPILGAPRQNSPRRRTNPRRGKFPAPKLGICLNCPGNLMPEASKPQHANSLPDSLRRDFRNTPAYVADLLLSCLNSTN
jgi:hypothetical protein